MNMSKAAMAPIQPVSSPTEQAHPRYAEYRRYLNNCGGRLLVQGDCFGLWLANVERKERGHEVVFHTQPGATLVHGWYKHKFAPHSARMTRFGPFATRKEAEAS